MTAHPYQAPDTIARAWHWRDDAACIGKAALFLPRKEFGPEANARIDAAKMICERCPVKDACLTDAMATEGTFDARSRAAVRGGLTPDERYARYRRKTNHTSEEPPTLLDQYLRRTEPLDGGHVRWTVTTPYITFKGCKYTGMQLAWALSTKRPAKGLLRATCGLAGCVAAEHLADEAMRNARDRYRSWKAAA